MDTAAYLNRIGYSGSLATTLDALRALHRAHLFSVPFENLDIHLGRPIGLDEASLFEKIVVQRRGGFCYELNGLFAVLLRELGFDVTLLSARVLNGDGSFGPEFDHMVSLVQLDERWLADVGFGDSFVDPLRLDESGDQVQDGRAYRVTHTGAEWRMLERCDDSSWCDGYLFTLQPRRLTDFAGMCHFQQTSPESHFTRKRICSRAMLDGRVTLSDMRLIVTSMGQRQDRLLADEAEYAAALHEHFGIILAR